MARLGLSTSGSDGIGGGARLFGWRAVLRYGLDSAQFSGTLLRSFSVLAARVRSSAERIIAGPHWKLRATVVVLAFGLFRAFPNYNFLRDAGAQQTWRDAAIKIQHPAADMVRLFPPASHEAKLTFRLTGPLLARVLHLDRTAMLVLFWLCGVVILYLALDLAHRITRSRIAALWVCVAFACIWPGMLAFHQLLGGFYDAPRDPAAPARDAHTRAAGCGGALRGGLDR